jgi:trk system potassium uptake protein TrkA
VRVVIMGASKIGSNLADMLENENHEVIIIDITPDGFNRLSPSFKGRKIVGSGTDLDLLKKLNFGSEDAFVAATNSENTNIAAAKMVKETFGCKRVAKLVYDPLRSKAFREVDKGVVCPILEAAIHFKELISS